MVDPRNDLATIWDALDQWASDLFFDADGRELNCKAYDDVCEAMARITERLGYDPVELCE